MVLLLRCLLQCLSILRPLIDPPWRLAKPNLRLDLKRRQGHQDLQEYLRDTDLHLGDQEGETYPLATLATGDPFIVDKLILIDTIEEIMVPPVHQLDLMIDFYLGLQIKMHPPIRLPPVEKTVPILFITGPML